MPNNIRFDITGNLNRTNYLYTLKVIEKTDYFFFQNSNIHIYSYNNYKILIGIYVCIRYLYV